MIRDKVVPINTKGMMKNRGVFQKANIMEQREGQGGDDPRCKDGITTNQHYFSHRVVYAFRNGELSAKIKNLVALELYDSQRKDLEVLSREVCDVRMTKEEADSVKLKRVEGFKHQVVVERGENCYVYSLSYEGPGEQMQDIPLTN